MTRLALTALVLAVATALAGAPVGAQSDLDALMQRVLSRRDENWKKLQQYVLEERESIDLRGPQDTVVWGDQAEYVWFIRDGFFVRSPIKANGVTIAEADRRKYEAEFLLRERERDERAAAARASAGDTPPAPAPPGDLTGLIRQTREPRFVSTANFLRFRFDQGRYALAGREALDHHQVLRIEYYPTNLFPQDRRGPGRLGRGAVDTETRRLLNKVALVTLWVDPDSAQILKYTFDNVALDFLPAQWLVRVDSVRATMTMGEAFADVWLPRDLDMNIRVVLAVGDFSVRYRLEYHDYRQADVTSTLHVPEDR